MDKIIRINDKEVGFRATALTPRLYRHKIGKDLVQDLNQLQKSYVKAMQVAGVEKPGKDASPEEIQAYEQVVEDAQLSVLDLEIFENAAYIMARQYDSSIPNTPEEWLDGFDTFSIYEILPHILDLWALNTRTTAIPKKK